MQWCRERKRLVGVDVPRRLVLVLLVDMERQMQLLYVVIDESYRQSCAEAAVQQPSRRTGSPWERCQLLVRRMKALVSATRSQTTW